MKGEIVAALLVAVGGLVTALGVQVRGMMGDRFQRKVDQAAALLSGYTAMVNSLREELKECQEAGAKALLGQREHARRNAETVRAAHEYERDNWRAEKAELKAEISRLSERLEDLLTQVYVLQNPPREEPSD